MPMSEHPRRRIYYWKCDRPAAFHGTAERDARSDLEPQLRSELAAHFSREAITLSPAGGQGNHITFLAKIGGVDAFVRIEDGPERDDYIEVESHLLGEVRALGVPTPRVLGVEARRARVPFAWQVLENIPHPDLNTHFKNRTLDVATIAHAIGAAVGRWQAVQPDGFGPFDPAILSSEKRLQGFHANYADYTPIICICISTGISISSPRVAFSLRMRARTSPLKSPAIIRCSPSSAAASSTRISRFGTSSAASVTSPRSLISTTPSRAIRWTTSRCSRVFTMPNFCTMPSQVMKASVRCPRSICGDSGCTCCAT